MTSGSVAGDVFRVDAGACAVAAGACVASPRWPRAYGNGESCVRAERRGVLSRRFLLDTGENELFEMLLLIIFDEQVLEGSANIGIEGRRVPKAAAAKQVEAAEKLDSAIHAASRAISLDAIDSYFSGKKKNKRAVCTKKISCWPNV